MGRGFFFYYLRVDSVVLEEGGIFNARFFLSPFPLIISVFVFSAESSRWKTAYSGSDTQFISRRKIRIGRRKTSFYHENDTFFIQNGRSISQPGTSFGGIITMGLADASLAWSLSIYPMHARRKSNCISEIMRGGGRQFRIGADVCRLYDAAISDTSYIPHPKCGKRNLH